MARKLSAGILLYRIRSGALEVLLVHPGGPFWAKKDTGAWSIPKGEFEDGADPLETAKREFLEETGSPVRGKFVALVPLKQKSGKIIYAWAVEGNLDASTIVSNTFSMDWPPRSGKQREFPEVDRGEWFTIPAAREKLQEGQLGFLDELERLLTQGT
ncbi:MAG TPA: NUDIX domain-containing protein [Burkholderiales bacterium]